MKLTRRVKKWLLQNQVPNEFSKSVQEVYNRRQQLWGEFIKADRAFKEGAPPHDRNGLMLAIQQIDWLLPPGMSGKTNGSQG